MKKICPLIVVVALLCSSCAMQTRSADDAMLNFLPYLNQKVAGYLDAYPEYILDSENYKKIVEEECIPLRSCGKNAAILFETYNVQPRMLDGMFSVMLCDKNMKVKVMEDFSCNEQKVEFPSFQKQKQGCDFEQAWQNQIEIDCPGAR